MKVRKWIISAVLAGVAILMAAAPALADSTGPGW